MVCTKKHKRENNTERKERRFRAVSVFVLFHSSAFVFELFRFLFIKCVNALLFSPTRNKRREVEEREVCFENNNTQRERERVRERVSGRCFVAALCFVRAFFAFLFVSSVFPTNKLVDTTERYKCNLLHHNRPCRWRDDWSPNQSRELSEEEEKEAGYF